MNTQDAKTCFCPIHTFIISAPVIVLAQQTGHAYLEHEIRSHARMSEAMPYFLVPDETAACIPPGTHLHVLFRYAPILLSGSSLFHSLFITALCLETLAEFTPLAFSILKSNP